MSQCVVLDGSKIKPSSKIGPMVIIAADQTCKIAVEDNYENSDGEDNTDDDEDIKSEDLDQDVDHQEGDTKREIALLFYKMPLRLCNTIYFTL